MHKSVQSLMLKSDSSFLRCLHQFVERSVEQRGNPVVAMRVLPRVALFTLEKSDGGCEWASRSASQVEHPAIH